MNNIKLENQVSIEKNNFGIIVKRKKVYVNIKSIPHKNCIEYEDYY